MNDLNQKFYVYAKTSDDPSGWEILSWALDHVQFWTKAHAESVAKGDIVDAASCLESLVYANGKVDQALFSGWR